LVLRFKNKLKEKKLFALASACLLLALFIAFFNAQYGGLILRYTIDYLYLLFIPALIVALLLLETLKGKNKQILLRFIAVSFFVTLAFNLFPRANEIWAIWWQRNLPNVSFALKHAIEFWN
jgi:hypothetical protein